MLRLLFALSIGTWLGALVCVAFIVAPIAHGQFPPAQARRLLRPLFPRCYLVGIACGFAALGAVALGKASLPRDEVLRLILPTAAALLCTIAGYGALLPRLRDLEGDDPRFPRVHQLSTMLNSTTIGALVLAMAAVVTR